MRGACSKHACKRPLAGCQRAGAERARCAGGQVPLSALKWQQQQLAHGCPVTVLDHATDPQLQARTVKCERLFAASQLQG